MELKKIAIMGSGQMGTSIAQVVATAGFNVVVRDIAAKIFDKSREKIQKSLAKSVEKGKMKEADVPTIMGRITFTEDMKSALADADYVIETLPEDMDLKKKIFAEMDKIAKPSAIFATNTGGLSVTKISEAVARKDRFIGTHWFFPPTVMRLIEIVVAPTTSKETLAVSMDFAKKVGKETVVCKDSPGFITTRALIAITVECLKIYEEGVASVEDIDKALRLGLNYPMGPIELADLTGLDTLLHGLEWMSEAYGDRYKPTESLKKLVAAGHLGQKVGKGFYDYKK